MGWVDNMWDNSKFAAESCSACKNLQTAIKKLREAKADPEVVYVIESQHKIHLAEEHDGYSKDAK